MSNLNLIKGDCMEIMRNMSPNSVDLIVTSPPYNKGLFNKCKQSNQIWGGFEIKYNSYNDNLSKEEYEQWMLDFFDLCSVVLKDGGSLLFNHKPIRHDNTIYHPMEFILKSKSMEVYQELIWDRKSSPNIRNDVFVPCTERIYWLKKKGQKPVFDRSKISKDYISEVWNITAKRNKQHPAPFPYELAMNCVLPFTNINKTITVLDPFMGCGTTGIVCKDLGIDFIGVEIDESYYNIAKDNISVF